MKPVIPSAARNLQLKSSYVLWVSMDIDPSREKTLHRVYERDHLPTLLSVPGVRSAQRLVTTHGGIVLGGQVKPMDEQDIARHHTVYQIDSPDVLVSPEWRAAVDAGEWAANVRPFLTNRRHTVFEVVQSSP
jgi:hypothetical protein